MRWYSWLAILLVPLAGYWIWRVRAPWYLARTFDHISAISPDGRRLLGSEGVIDAESGKLILKVSAWESAGFSSDGISFKPQAMFSADGRFLEFDADPARQVWDIDAGKDITAQHPYGWIVEGKYVATPFGSNDGVTLRDGSTGKTIASLERPGGPTRQPVSDDDLYDDIRFAFSHDRSQLSTSYGRWLCVWESATGKLLRKIEVGEPHFVRDVALAPDGKRAACLDRGDVQLWDTTNGILLASAKVHTSDGYATIEFTPDYRRIIVGYQAALDAQTLTLIGQSPNHGVWANDGRHVMCRNNGVYVIWDVDRNVAEVEQMLAGDAHGRAAFTSDGSAALELPRWRKDTAVLDAGESPGPATYWKRRRPDVWWGYGYLPAVWVAAALLLIAGFSLVHDLRRG